MGLWCRGWVSRCSVPLSLSLSPSLVPELLSPSHSPSLSSESDGRSLASTSDSTHRGQGNTTALKTNSSAHHPAGKVCVSVCVCVFEKSYCDYIVT